MMTTRRCFSWAVWRQTRRVGSCIAGSSLRTENLMLGRSVPAFPSHFLCVNGSGPFSSSQAHHHPKATFPGHVRKKIKTWFAVCIDSLESFLLHWSEWGPPLSPQFKCLEDTPQLLEQSATNSWCFASRERKELRFLTFGHEMQDLAFS